LETKGKDWRRKMSPLCRHERACTSMFACSLAREMNVRICTGSLKHREDVRVEICRFGRGLTMVHSRYSSRELIRVYETEHCH
jgi:hypothetical protein